MLIQPVVANDPPPATVKVTAGDGCATFTVAPGSWFVAEIQRPNWVVRGQPNAVVNVADGQVVRVDFQNEEITPPTRYTLYLPFVAKGPGPTPVPPLCAGKKMRIQYSFGGIDEVRSFEPEPSTTWQMFLLRIGQPVNLSVADGSKVADSYLGWFDGYTHDQPYGAQSRWTLVAGYNPGDLRPGLLYHFAAKYQDKGKSCTFVLEMQWDPPEGAHRPQGRTVLQKK